ncbi:MAG: SMC-Scp complex subunit ScpB [Nitrospirota bacterium]
MALQQIKASVEALLYVSDTPLSLRKIKEAFGEDSGVEQGEIQNALTSLQEDFNSDGRGVRIAELAGGYQIITRPEYAAYIKRLQKIKPPRLSAPALETLAIIAYRQPLIRAEIEAIRGVNADGVLKTLLERRLIRIAGRQDVPGKPIMYATTADFLQYFGLRDLSSLPSLRELERELGMEENTILGNLEPELPGLDGPEMERMAEEYREKRRADIEAEEASLAAQAEAELAEFKEEVSGGAEPDEPSEEAAREPGMDNPCVPDAGDTPEEILEELDKEEQDGF